jgi:hypothetical protein
MEVLVRSFARSSSKFVENEVLKYVFKEKAFGTLGAIFLPF